MEQSARILSDVTVHAKYAKYLEESRRRETWEEAVERNKAMHLARYPHMRQDIDAAYQLVLDKRLLPSMRSMQFAGRAIELNHARGYNCSYLPIDHPRAFPEIMFLLLSGCGVGYSVQSHHVFNLPHVKTPDGKQRFVIQDSIIGWAEAVKALINAYLLGKYLPDFEYGDVRPKGARLKTAGGTAPGPEPLQRCLDRVRQILSSVQTGQKLLPIHAHDIACSIADCVLAGGIRRSAMISLFDRDDDAMMVAKSGQWWEDAPERARANNSSVLIRDKVDEIAFKNIWESVESSNSGEPGVYWTNNREWGSNPCFAPETRIATQAGWLKISDMVGKELAVATDMRVGKDNALSDEKGVRILPAQPARLTRKQARVYTLTTDHGHKITATANHIYPTDKGRKELQELQPGDTLFLPSGQTCFGNQGDYESGLILGIITGDGTFANDKQAFVDIWANDFDRADELRAMVSSAAESMPTKKREYGPLKWIETANKKRIGGVRLYRWMESVMGEGPLTVKEKVPECVWRGTKDMVRGYIQGMLFSDGSIQCTGKDKKQTISIRFHQSNAPMLREIQTLLSGFGISSKLYSRRPEGYRAMPDGNGGERQYFCKESFELIVNRPNAITFRDEVGVYGRKASLLDQYLEERGTDCKKPERFIARVKSVEFDRITDVYCLTQPETNTVVANGVVAGQCVEVSLRPHQFCNLVEGNAQLVNSQDELEEVAYYGSLLATLQAGYTDFHFLRPIWKKTTERDALIGMSWTGIAGSRLQALDLEAGAVGVRHTNWDVAGRIGINYAARTTCIKPSGTTSLVLGTSSGIHAWHAPYYLRRVTLNKSESLFAYMQQNAPHLLEDSVTKEDEAYVVVPMKAPDDAVYRTESPLDLLDRVHDVYTRWVKPGHLFGANTNNISCTVSVKDNEWDEVGRWMWDFRDSYNGLSVLPYDGGTYQQTPFEECSKEEYETRISGLSAIDLVAVHEDSDATTRQAEPACAGGACEI